MTLPAIEIAALVDKANSCQKTRAVRNGSEGGAEQVFVQFLDEALGRGQTDELPWSHDFGGGIESQGGWFESFKHALHLSGIGLNNMSLGSNALEGLKKLLLADGLAEEDVKDFLNGLLGDKARKEINISELLYKIGELKEKFKNQSIDFVLEPSVLPHLDVLLRSFGLNVRQVELLMSQARIDGGKLSLKALADTLKTVVIENNKTGKTQTALVSAEAVKETLDRMGMSKEAGMLDGPVSLTQFVRLIEDKVASLIPYHLSDTQEKRQIGGLLENISVITKGNADKTLVSKPRGMVLKEVLSQDEKANAESKQANSGIDQKLGQTQKKAFGAGETNTYTNGEMEIKEIDSNKLTQQMVNEKEIPVKVDKLIESGTAIPAERGSDSSRSTLPPGFHDHAMSRVSVTENVAKADVRSIPMHVVNQVGRRLGLAVRRGENHVRLQLKPPHLGAIQLDLAMKDSGLKIMMVAENQYVKDLMVSHVNELREALANQGVELQKIDVEISRNFGQSMADAGGESDKAGPRVRTTASASDKAEDDMIGTHFMSHTVHGDGRLDMFA